MSNPHDRPFWSVMITSYNRDLIVHAIRSVLQQDQGPERMQIHVVDDASPDVDIARLVAEVGQGRVEFHRNEKNIGLYPNCNVAVSLARGKWVHILHDDDVVYPGFYTAMEAADTAADFGGKPIGAAFCRPDNIDPEGKSTGPYPPEATAAGPLPDFQWRAITGNPILFPSVVVKKSVYEALNAFTPEVGNAADWVMWGRIAQSYAFWYDPRVLAGYRRHSASVSADLSRTASDMEGITQAIEHFEKILPPALKTRQLLAIVRERMAMLSMEDCRKAFRRGDLFAGNNHIRQALLCSSSTRVSREIEKGVMRDWDAYVRNSISQIHKFSANPRDPLQTNIVRAIRYAVGGQIMDAQPDEFPVAWAELYSLTLALIHSPLRNVPLDPADMQLVNSTLAQIHNSPDDPDVKWAQRLMLAALYCYPPELIIPPRNVPDWLLPSYAEIMLIASPAFASPEAKIKYEDALRDLRNFLVNHAPDRHVPTAQYWKDAVAFFKPKPTPINSANFSFGAMIGPWFTMG